MTSLEDISPHCVAITSVITSGNVGGIRLKSYSIAIDSTGSAAEGKSFRENLEAHFGVPVKYFVLTHCHGDHTQGLNSFKDTKMICSNQTVKAMPKSFQRAEFDTVTFSDKFLIEDDDLSVEIYHAGGHTAGSLYIWFPQERVLFAGDLIFAKSFPYLGDPNCNPDQWIEALNNFLLLDFEKLVPGHGPVVGKEEVQKHLDFFEEFKMNTLDTINSGKSASDIIIPDFYKYFSPRAGKDASVRKSAKRNFYKFYK
ncbi:MAG: MBL fold metallo-hydrolase [Candidatus Hermodarchaeota archaeon]